MKQFTATHFNPATGLGETEHVTADHYSVSSAGPNVVAHFYRKPLVKSDPTRLPPRDADGERGPKDDLIATIREPLTVRLDENSLIIEAEFADLSDDLLDRLAELLGVKSLDDEQKIRLVVTLTE